MSDSLLETFLHYGTNAQRLAFTPVPPTVSGTAVKVLYEWRETDTGDVYLYDTSWHLLVSGTSSAVTSLTGDVTGTGPGATATTIANNAVTTAKINNAAVTLAKIANAAASSKVLGSGASGSGAAYAEITLGTGLTMTGTTLSAAGSGGTVTTTGSPASGNLTKFSGAASVTNADLTGDVTTSGTVATTLASTAVTPGSYTSTDLTVDAKGRITAASNGTGGGGTVTHTAGALTANEIVVGNGSGDLKVVAATDGQIPIGKTSDGSVTLATLTQGSNISITNGAGTITIAASGSAAAVGLVGPLEQHTASSSASLDFTACISSTYDQYQIEFVNVIPATNAVSASILVSTNGGSTWDTTAIYSVQQNYSFSNTVGATASTGLSAWTLAGNLSNDSHYGINGTFTLCSPLSTALYNGLVGQFQNFDSSVSNIINRVSCWYASTTAVNAFQFKFSSGNIASGIIRVYGVAK